MADQHDGEHKHGSMDIREQEKTFGGFVRMSIWVVGISLGILVFLALVNS
jgi:Bacterial aa3 type cytochrome c oxidase subunit IV